ncbi:MAG TPA: AMP-binding protein [Acidimicrobiales bacterium]|nr:AMP-binding protein [Acidimicrobiales bacterium]
MLARTEATPDALFLVDEEGRRLSFSEFHAAALSAAAGLRELGVGPGVVVAWALPTSINTCVIMAALSRLSVCQIPIVPTYGAREISHIVRDSVVDVMVVGASKAVADYPAILGSIATTNAGRPEVIALGSQLPTGDEGSLPPPPARPRPGDPGAVRWHFYTSGSSGLPKGVRHSDRGLAAVAGAMAARLEMGPSDRNGLAFPIAHVGGPINLLASFVAGSAQVLLERFHPARAVAVLQREGVTMAGSGTAFHLGYLEVQRGQPGRPIFPGLRCCPGGGAPKPPGLHEEVKAQLGGAGILSGWGLTEAPVLTMGQSGDPDIKLSSTEGRPLPGVEVRVRLDDGEDLPAGAVGELRVRAPQMMIGYVDPLLNADAFDEDGFLRSGDLGLVDDDGYVTITGRLKDVVIRNGENISAAEVEELIRLHPHVVDAVVVGLPDERTGERLCAVVEQRAGREPLDVTRIGAHLQAHGLRRLAWPEQVELVPSLPRTVAGKVDKPELRARFTPGPADNPLSRDPGDEGDAP